MSEPMCRGCYAATLTPDELDRFNAEPVTSCVYLCPEHQAAIDRALATLPKFNLIDTRKRVHPPHQTADTAAEAEVAELRSRS